MVLKKEMQFQPFYSERLNRNADINIKTGKYPGTSSTDMIQHLKTGLRKEPDKILIHAGKNDLINDQNYLNNVKKIIKMVNGQEDM